MMQQEEQIAGLKREVETLQGFLQQLLAPLLAPEVVAAYAEHPHLPGELRLNLYCTLGLYREMLPYLQSGVPRGAIAPLVRPLGVQAGFFTPCADPAQLPDWVGDNPEYQWLCARFLRLTEGRYWPTQRLADRMTGAREALHLAAARPAGASA